MVRNIVGFFVVPKLENTFASLKLHQLGPVSPNDLPMIFENFAKPALKLFLLFNHFFHTVFCHTHDYFQAG